jgi:type III pantothenate kinase
MHLLIDIGNTRLKWAFARPDAKLGVWFASAAIETVGPENLAGAWASALGGVTFQTICTAVLISNVAGPQGAAMINAQLRRLDPDHSIAIRWLVSTSSLCGVENRYRDAAKLGCDRFAALIGARALQPAVPLCVVNCGTATTIDALSASGQFVGGWILPGLNLMKGALATKTAQLPDRRTSPHDDKFSENIRREKASANTSSCEPDRLFGDNTGAAIDLGCEAAQSGAINRAVSLYDNAHCILSGGDAKQVSNGIEGSFTLVENLVLIGLQVIARKTETQSCISTQMS